MFVGTAETAAQEREAIRDRSRGSRRRTRNTPWSARRYRPDQVREVIQTRLQSEQPPDSSATIPARGSPACWRKRDSCVRWKSLQGERVGDLRLGQAAGHLRRQGLRRPEPGRGVDRLLQQGPRPRGAEDRGRASGRSPTSSKGRTSDRVRLRRLRSSGPPATCSASGPATSWAEKGWTTSSTATAGGTPPRWRRRST